MEETIAAITTAPGTAGVGIIRISGPEAAAVADRVFRSKNKKALAERPTYTVTYGHIYGDKEQLIDEALALTMWEPRSFTGENVVELQCHGGSVVLRKILELVLANGARLAEPGEFSKRAFLNGRLDLSQAEAIQELITAKTEKGVQAAARNLVGGISDKVKELRKKVLEITAYLEADIDYPEDDFERLEPEELENRLSVIIEELKKILSSYENGKIIRDGLKTVLAGRPNVGKSSLLNALLQEKRAIVTDIPGTTRDVIQEYYNLGGIPIVLHDTAGLRQTDDEVEKIGVEMTRELIKESDLILYVIDSTSDYGSEDEAHLKELPVEKTLVLVNKIDLLEEHEKWQLPESLKSYTVVFISAKEGQGLDDLTRIISQMFIEPQSDKGEEPLLTNLRQKEALSQAHNSLQSAVSGIRAGLDADFISIDLRTAWESLGEVTGDTLGDDIIGQIFSQFCLGK